MLCKDFAEPHSLCEYGGEQLDKIAEMELSEAWTTDDQDAAGTVLFWIASRSQVDKKPLLKACCACAREVLPVFDDPTEPETLISVVEGWCNGTKTKTDVAEVGQNALEHMRTSEDEAKYIAWCVIFRLTRIVHDIRKTPGLGRSVAIAWEKAGKGSGVEIQRKMAGIVRQHISWMDVQNGIDQNLPSISPRKKSVDEVLDQAQEIIKQIAELQKKFEEVKAQVQACHEEAGVTEELIQENVQDENRIGAENYRYIQEKLAELDAADAAEEAPSKKKSKVSRRQRTMI